ncbi:hypothetical protein BKA62DRAFT_764600 [Auriculariales sp. MPI-PUGE-AT-0066]|nr:hypothetical protein BKA62DRAFT_764600 [Auriculariales sp. MPI-PUGE-AT-0066]
MVVFFSLQVEDGSRRSWLPLFLLIFVLLRPVVRAAFTRDALFHLDWVRKNPAGPYCFHPNTLPGRSGSCVDPALDALLATHTSPDRGPGISIAYYDLRNLAVLGGADWNGWNMTSGPVGLCLSGAVEGTPDAFLTKCRFASRDDDQDDPTAHARECVSNIPQRRVLDGCYTPPPLTPTGRDASGDDAFADVDIVDQRGTPVSSNPLRVIS